MCYLFLYIHVYNCLVLTATVEYINVYQINPPTKRVHQIPTIWIPNPKRSLTISILCKIISISRLTSNLSLKITPLMLIINGYDILNSTPTIMKSFEFIKQRPLGEMALPFQYSKIKVPSRRRGWMEDS